MRCRYDASTDFVMAVQYRYVLDVHKDRGNLRKEENNDKVMYKKKKMMISLENDVHSF